MVGLGRSFVSEASLLEAGAADHDGLVSLGESLRLLRERRKHALISKEVLYVMTLVLEVTQVSVARSAHADQTPACLVLIGFFSSADGAADEEDSSCSNSRS